jgi:hypothetical protein
LGLALGKEGKNHSINRLIRNLLNFLMKKIRKKLGIKMSNLPHNNKNKEIYKYLNS